MRVHLISFGAPFKKYSAIHNRIHQNILNFGIFSNNNLFSEHNIFDFCPEIYPFKDFLSQSRGYGYWIWQYF